MHKPHTGSHYTEQSRIQFSYTYLCKIRQSPASDVETIDRPVRPDLNDWGCVEWRADLSDREKENIQLF
jgi:hypothetical protein